MGGLRRLGAQLLRPRATFWVALTWLVSAACGPAARPSGVTVRLVNGDGARRPDHVLVTWLGDGAVLFKDRRLPQSGSFGPGADEGPLSTLFVETTARAHGLRTIIAQGVMGDGAVISEGTATVILTDGRGEVELALHAGRRNDLDGDGLPDVVLPPPLPDGGVDQGPDTAPATPVKKDAAPSVGTDALTAVGVPDTGPPAPIGGQALLLVGAVPLNAFDVALERRLRQLGFEVLAKREKLAVSADAAGRKLVVISPTVAAYDLAGKFRDVKVPVVCFEAYVLDDMSMTGKVQRTDFGHDLSQTEMVVTTPSHPIAAGQSGTITLFSAPQSLGWGIPGATAQVVATTTATGTHATVFAYDRGAAMVGHDAPARRVGLFGAHFDADILTPQAWSMVEGAVRWAIAP